MKAVNFKEANILFTKPKEMSDSECSSLPAYSDGREITSVWQMSLKERLKVLFTGKVWFGIICSFQPPIWLGVNKPFLKTNLKPRKEKMNAK